MGKFLLKLILTLSLGFNTPTWAAAIDPLDYSLRQYAFLFGVAVFGGFVSFYAKVKAGKAAAWNIMHLIGELATSAFAGLVTFWLCEAASAPKLITISLVAIAGHMGTRAIAGFENWAEKKFGAIIKLDDRWVGQSDKKSVIESESSIKEK